MFLAGPGDNLSRIRLYGKPDTGFLLGAFPSLLRRDGNRAFRGSAKASSACHAPFSGTSGPGERAAPSGRAPLLSLARRSCHITNLPGKTNIDNMNYSSYTKDKMAWEVETTEEYDTWFLGQTENGQESIRMKVELLIEYGPYLSRPHADTLKGSRLNNLKELRAQTENHVFRIAFLFDEKRKAVLLIGGDKKSKNEKRFYRSLIKQAEAIYRQYLDDEGRK
jgi:hypothetical protein